MTPLFRPILYIHDLVGLIDSLKLLHYIYVLLISNLLTDLDPIKTCRVYLNIFPRVATFIYIRLYKNNLVHKIYGRV